jgi:phage terminase large subunit-like protein
MARVPDDSPRPDRISRGKAAKKIEDRTPGPWTSWSKRLSRHGRAIRFLQTYCPSPKGYGAGRPLRLAPFQKGWLEEVLADGVSSAAMSLPRGNGKSTFLAGLSVWAVFDADGTGDPQVPVVATTINQAIRSVYGVALAMVERSEELARRALVFSGIGTQRIVVPSTGGEMFPVSSDPSGLQGLDPSLGVVDELGFIPVDSWDSLLLASGKRPRSLVVGIGTPGFDRDNALWHLRRRVAEGRPVPGFRYTEYAAPDGCPVDDEEAWRVANPAIAARFMNVAALRTAVELSPESHFRIFRLGQWVDGVESWLGADGRRIWEALGSPYGFADGADTWLGVDVALVRDSTALVAVQGRPDGRWQAKARIWQPTPGEPVDVTDVMAAIREMDKAYRIRSVGYDPRFFDVPAKMLGDEGLPMVEFPQSVERMTAAIGGLYEAIRRGEIAHDADPAFTAQILNAVARYNERGFTLAKAKSRGRIDATIALSMALWLARREPEAATPFNVW